MAVATENYKFSIPNLCDYRTLRVFRKPLFIPISYFDTCKLKPSKVRFSQCHKSYLWNDGWIPNFPSLGPVHFYFLDTLPSKT